MKGDSMENANSGYVGYSMSVRAEQAYNNGLLPLSKIKAKQLRENGIDISLIFFKWLVTYNHITPTEWHHTGKLFTKTYFYDLKNINEQINELNIQDLRKEFISNRNKDRGYYAKVEYKEWSGSRRYGHYVTETAFVYVFKGWAYINENTKKSINRKNFAIQETYKRKPKKMNTHIRNRIFTRLKLK